MYRCYVYPKFPPPADMLETFRLTSQSFNSHEAASAYLDGLMDTGCFTGGSIEVKVEDIGWVLDE